MIFVIISYLKKFRGKLFPAISILNERKVNFSYFITNRELVRSNFSFTIAYHSKLGILIKIYFESFIKECIIKIDRSLRNALSIPFTGNE